MASAAGGRITAGVGANLIGQHAQDRNQEATVYVGSMDPQVVGKDRVKVVAIQQHTHEGPRHRSASRFVYR